MRRLAISLLFFCSGVAGLIYQVIWVRQFGNIFGNTIYSASVVTSIFMLGLGVGSSLVGRWCDRTHATDPQRLLRAYGLFEIGIAVIGLAVALLLPTIAQLSAAISSYVREPSGLFSLSWTTHLLRGSVAVVLLTPAALLMGGTLTFLIRYVVSGELAAVGWRVGALYGVNTAGAALGALLVDFFLAPALGLFATQACAVVLNLGVGLAAMRWAARPRAAVSAADAFVVQPESSDPQGRALMTVVGVALFLSGFAAMGMEILWFRLLSTVLGTYRGVFSLILAVILCGIWLGSMAGGAAHRRLGHAVHLFVITQGAFVISALLILLFIKHAPLRGHLDATLGVPPSFLLARWVELRPVLVVVGLPAFCMGFSFPLANAAVQQAATKIGRRAGLLYLSNTVGAVAGSLTAGFVALPALGLQSSIVLMAICAAAAVVPLFITFTGRHRSCRSVIVPLASVLAAAALIVLWGRLPAVHLAQRIHIPISTHEKPLGISEGVNESIVITELPDGTRRLYTNGHPMSATFYLAQRYMRAFAHVPLLLLEQPRRVMVICFGVGNTMHAASLHPSVQTLEVVDLSRHVLEHAGYFARWNHHVLRDPRVKIYVNDGRHHLRMQPSNSYDLITLEPPPIEYAGVASLYSREFYELASRRLRSGGYLTQWMPVYQVPRWVAAAMIQAFVAVFPESIALSGHESELILVGRKDLPLRIDPLRVARRLRGRPAVQRDLASVDLGTLVELIGSYIGDAATLRDVAGDMPPVTDDLPLLEYSDGRFRPTLLPAALFRPTDVARWCPRCYMGGKPVPALRDLPTYLAFMQTLYRDRQFLTKSLASPIASAAVPADRESVDRTYRSSGYLQRLFAPLPSPAPR